jgi:hypothetical protein
MTAVREFSLGDTPTYSGREVTWVPGGSTPWDGFLVIKTIASAAKVDTTTYAVGIDGDGGKVMLKAMSGAKIPERIERMRSDRQARCYLLTIRGNRVTCNCPASVDCKHASSLSQLIDSGVLRCEVKVSLSSSGRSTSTPASGSTTSSSGS